MPILDQNTPQSYIPYLATGTGVFSANGSPEGVQNGGIGSIYTDLLTGNLYTKTTAYALLTGWVLSGGGGVGTVTSFSAGNLSPLFNSSVATATSTPALTFAQISQAANLFFASPNGSAGNPTFRAIATADLAGVGIAAAPANAIQYNNGTNGFAGDVNLLYDAATATIQAGVAAGITGKLQLRSSVSGSITHTVNNPAGNYSVIWFDTLPTNNDLARFSVSGSNVTISSVAASALGFPTINATDGVLPYRSSATAFSDSPVIRVNSTTISLPVSSTAATPSIIGAASGNLNLQGVGGGNGVILGGNATNMMVVHGLGTWWRSDTPIGWASSTTIPTAGGDTGFARRQAGYVRVTNGSTGIGGLLVGGSTATPIGQTHLINGAVGIISLFIESIAATSVATIKSENSSIQSFAFYPSGKLQGACNVPTSNQQFSAKGNLKCDVSELGNVGTGQDNLLSFGVPANSIANTGDTLEFKTTVVFAANANNKEVEILFGGVSVFLVSDLFSGSQAEIIVRIKRLTATTAKVIATWISSDVLLRADCQYNASIAITWGNANTFQVQGEATATDDIINTELESNVIIAQTS